MSADSAGLVRHDHPDTSHVAAASLTSKETLRRKVHSHIFGAGSDGATDYEIQTALDMDGNTERPRRVELVRGGLVEDSGKRRYINGRPHIVWVVKR